MAVTKPQFYTRIKRHSDLFMDVIKVVKICPAFALSLIKVDHVTSLKPIRKFTETPIQVNSNVRTVELMKRRLYMLNSTPCANTCSMSYDTNFIFSLHVKNLQHFQLQSKLRQYDYCLSSSTANHSCYMTNCTPITRCFYV